MSVRESERDQSSIEFLKVLMDIEKWTIRKTNICPKKYRFIVNTQLLTHAANAYSFAKMGNSVRVHDYESKLLREKYITKAYVSIQAYASQIDVIYAVCKSDFMTNHELEEISGYAFEALKLLNANSDKVRNIDKYYNDMFVKEDEDERTNHEHVSGSGKEDRGTRQEVQSSRIAQWKRRR